MENLDSETSRTGTLETDSLEENQTLQTQDSINELHGRFCSECKFSEKLVGYWCKYPEVHIPVFDPVNGKVVYSEMICETARRHENLCGPQGRWWEMKDEEK